MMNASLCAFQSGLTQFYLKFNEAYDLVETDPKGAVSTGMKAHDIAKEQGNLWAMGLAKSVIGYISYEVGDFKRAYVNYANALEDLKESDTVDLFNEATILNELSLIQSDFNNHDESIRYSEMALKRAKQYIRKYPDHAEQNDQLSLLVDIPYYMAIEYQEKGAHQTAGKILVELWEEAEDKTDILTYSLVLNELGIVKMNNGEYDDAQGYFGLVVSGKGVYEEDKSIAYHNLAETYMEQGNYDKANSYFLIALDMKKELEDDHSVFVTYQGLGKLEYRAGNSEKAIEYWETGLTVYDNIDTDPELYDIYNSLQLAYMDSDIQKAKEFNVKYSQINDFYVRNQTEQRELEAQNRQALSDLIDGERDNRVNAAQRKEFFKQFWPIMLGVTLLLIFSAILGVRYYRTLRTNKELTLAQLSAQRSDDQD